MSYDESLVGAIAIIIAGISFAIGLGPWASPYQLPTIMAISKRFGKPVARGFWVVLALAALTAGVAILCGIRPNYAVPAPGIQIGR